MKQKETFRQLVRCLLLLLHFKLAGSVVGAATLSGEFVPVPRGTVVNLTSEGSVDWVHWGLYTETSLDRKAQVIEQIMDFKLVNPSNAFGAAYQFSDNWGGYSWSDGTPSESVTGTTTGVYSIGLGHGFQFAVPAGTTVKTLKVFVGAFGAKGKFQATLSDNSAPTYSDSSLSNLVNGPNGIYVIAFAGRSAGSKLNLKWTVEEMLDSTYGNVTLQAATLSSADANNLPFVSLTSPTDNANFSAGSDITFTANAVDFDGTIAKVEFFQGATKLGEDLTDPFGLVWTEAPLGKHTIWARATDDRGATANSQPIEIFVTTSGGALAGNVVKPPLLPALVNLTSEGVADWVHWGTKNNGDLDRKAGVSRQISDYLAIGNATAARYMDNYTGFSWTDGAPTASATNTKTGIYIAGETNGFELRLPADTTVRTAKVYVGLYAAQGSFRAWLSDYSANVYADTSLSNSFGNAYAAYTLNYSAASAGQTLTVRYTGKEVYDPDYGNVTLQSVTLAGGPPPNSAPVVSITAPTNGASFGAPANITIEASADDLDGTISKVEFFNDNTLLGDDTDTPYAFQWNDVPAGTYTLVVKATDDRGASTSSSPVTVLVTNNLPTAVLLIDPKWVGTDFIFSFASQPGQSYAVEHTAELSTTTWQLLGTLIGNGTNLSVTNANAQDAQRFYRVRAN